MFQKFLSLFKSADVQPYHRTVQAWHGHDGDPHHDHFGIEIPDSASDKARQNHLDTVVPQS